MKSFVAFAILAVAIIGVQSGPIAVSGNNVGDIVNVGVNVDAKLDTKIDSTIVNVLVALLTKVGDVQISAPEQSADFGQATAYINELMGHFKEHPEQLKQLLSSESAEKLIKQFMQH